MNAATDRLEFAPPPQPGFFRGLVLALIAHLLLLLALTWGVKWNRDAQNVAAEAELWASVPQQAAPPVVSAPPVVVAPPVPREEPKPVAREEPKPQTKPREADIAEEREKQRKQLQARREAEEERKEQQRRKAEAQRKEQEKKQQLAAEQRRKDEEKKRKEQQEEARIAKQREENIKRNLAMAGGGSPGSPGTAAQASGPSASWAGRVRARVRPNIVFTDDVAGNPTAEVEVRMAPDGTIVSRRLVKSSGVKSWDDAVLRALDKTEVLPRDTDGRVHSPVILEFKPRG